jgi:DNA-binding transcriptional LysR family regulator
VAFLPGVLKRLRTEAPNVRLRTMSRPRAVAAQALESGEADLAVGFFPDLQKPGYFQQALFKTSYACIACARNEAAPARMTLKQYLGARHIVVRPDGREHMLDRFLEDKGLHRHITLELSHFMSLLALLPGSDLIATVPQDIATVVGRHVPLKIVELPFRAPQIQVQQYWHRRLQNDPANRWLRALFHEVNRRDANGQMPG